MYQNLGFLCILIIAYMDDLLKLPSLIFSDNPFAFLYRRTTLDILLVLAVFILIAGAINFSNQSLARAMTHAKEVGTRKVLGAGRKHIIFQSLLEISVQCFISLVLALLLVKEVQYGAK